MYLMFLPKMYRGETSRTCFHRGQSHLKSYKSNDPETRLKSSLWRHTRDVHDGVYGDEGGTTDYGMTWLSQEEKPLDRLTQEGANIQELEDSQADGQIVCLNSKQDFIQSCRITLDYRTRELNE